MSAVDAGSENEEEPEAVERERACACLCVGVCVCVNGVDVASTAFRYPGLPM